jgi:hypothetical protein
MATTIEVSVTSGTTINVTVDRGDMFKSTYDTDADGKVDDSSKLGGQLPAYYLSRTNHTGTQLDYIVAVCSDESTPITIGVGKCSFNMPYAGTLTAVKATVNTAPTDADIIVDIKKAGVTVLSTLLRIDATNLTSLTSAIPAVISVPTFANDDAVTIDITQVGATIAGKGLKVTLTFAR